MHPVNFRDVGEAIELWVDPSPVAPGRLFRGGKLEHLTTLADVGSPRTILNLRRGRDRAGLGNDVRCLHVPADDDVENYDTRQPSVRRWLRSALEALADPRTTWPVYVHCTSGRDRTGVVVAAALILLDVPPQIVVEEYMLSDGANRARIGQAVEGVLEAFDALDSAVGAQLRAAVRPDR